MIAMTKTLMASPTNACDFFDIKFDEKSPNSLSLFYIHVVRRN